MSEYFRLVWSSFQHKQFGIASPVFGRHFCVTWEYILLIKNKQIFSPHQIALIASWVYNKGNFIHLVWNKGTGLQQNCCKVSDYQLGPPLKKNPFITFQTSLALYHYSVQFKMVCITCTEKPVCDPPCLSQKFPPTLPLKRFQCLSAPSHPVKEDRLALPLSMPLSSRR